MFIQLLPLVEFGCEVNLEWEGRERERERGEGAIRAERMNRFNL